MMSEDRVHTPRPRHLRPPHEHPDANLNADRVLPLIKKVLPEWPPGAQLTPMIIGDRFCISKDEAELALEKLLEKGLIKMDPARSTYHVK